MRQAMAEAEVGDDVYGEDPTVNTLEAEVAAMFGHEAAMFVPSGTMGNQIAIRLLVPPGGELLCDSQAHIVTYERGAAARYGGIQTRTLRGVDGLLDPAEVVADIRPADSIVPTAAVAVEQTHNRGGGAVYPLQTLQALRDEAGAQGVALHCDGARIWNAHVATGTTLSDYGTLFDTVSVCLSKGLGAPVGSVVVSSAERIKRGRQIRASLGGGMRQAGVLAAAGRYALQHHVHRLAEDHARARQVAEALHAVAPDVVDPSRTVTNIVRLQLSSSPLSATELQARARAAGVLVGAVTPTRVRIVTHLDVDDHDIAHAIDVLGHLLRVDSGY